MRSSMSPIPWLLIYPVTNFDTVQRAPVAAVNR